MIQSKTLDDKGRCCGRKPMRYTGKYSIGGPHRFCPRCDRAYHLTDNLQIPNWAWSYQLSEGGKEEFIRKYSGVTALASSRLDDQITDERSK